VLVACGGGEGGGDIWSARVNQFALEACDNVCIQGDRELCKSNVTVNLDTRRFDIVDENSCVACLRAKTDTVDQLIANNCMMSAAIEATLALSCDTDPQQDFDFDGDPANDLEASCLGAGRYPFLLGGGDDDPTPPPKE
jgi:hypothetical protein